MTYEVINQTVLKTPQGIIDLLPGQFIDINPEKAVSLVEMNRIRLIDGLEEYRNPKNQYNILLRQARLIETAFENKTLTLDEQGKRIEVYRAIIEALNDLLQEIKGWTHEEAKQGFTIH